MMSYVYIYILSLLLLHIITIIIIQYLAFSSIIIIIICIQYFIYSITYIYIYRLHDSTFSVFSLWSAPKGPPASRCRAPESRDIHSWLTGETQQL